MRGPSNDFLEVVIEDNGDQWEATVEHMVPGQMLPATEDLPKLDAPNRDPSQVVRPSRQLQIDGTLYKRLPVYALVEADNAKILDAAQSVVDWIKERYPNHTFYAVGRVPQYLAKREPGYAVALRRPHPITDPPSPFDTTKPPHILIGGYFYAIPKDNAQ